MENQNSFDTISMAAVEFQIHSQKTLQTNCYKLSILPAWPENTCIYIVFLVKENAVQIVGGSFRVRLKIFSRQEFFFD